MFGFVPRSLAVVGIVGALSFAMPVAAQADTSVSVIKFLANIATFGGVVGAGVKAAAPLAADVGEGFACAATAPVCAALAVAVVGGALYMTQDTWVPWIQGAFGGGGSNGAWSVGSGWKVRVDSSSDSTGLVIEAQYTGGVNMVDPNYHGHATCADGYQADTMDDIILTAADNAQVYFGDYRWGTYTPVGQSKISLRSGPCGTHGGLKGWTGGAYAGSTELVWGTALAASDIRTSTQVNCANADGSTYAVTSGVQPVNGDLVKIPTCTGAAGDTGTGHGTCVQLSAGPVDGTQVVQGDTCVAAGAAAAQYPNCVAAGCSYMVIVDGMPCQVGRPGCSDWTRTYQESPGRVGCRYGEYAVKVSSCFFLERIYEATGLPVDGTLANTDGNPATWTGDAPAPLAQPLPDGAPGGDPGTLPGGGTGTLPSPGSDPQTNNDCWSGGSFSWNPVDWVMVPVKCALSWAFVPTTATLTQLSTAASTDLTTQGIGPIVTAVTTNVTKVGGGGGCDGPAVTFSAVGIVKPMHPFSACTAPMSTLAAISYAMTTVVVVLGGGFVAVKAVGAGFGFNFSMRRGGGESA